MTLIPLYLHPGDKVAIAAPARKISLEEISPSISLLKEWGLKVVLPEGLFEEKGQLAGTDEHRADLMQRLLDDEEIRAIFCARGGYGSVRIIDKLDFTKFAKHPKWIVGYSDVTVFHSHIQRNLGISTLHATMPININNDSAKNWCKIPALETLHQALFEDSHSLILECSRPSINPSPEVVEGEIVGGNLSILYSLCGSDSDIDTDGKILLIEDLDEYLYHIDRMMQNLKRTGKLFGIKALIVGAMSDMHDNSTPFGLDAAEIIEEAVKGCGYPVVFTEKIGHVGLENVAVPLGRECRLTAKGDGKIEIRY